MKTKVAQVALLASYLASTQDLQYFGLRFLVDLVDTQLELGQKTAALERKTQAESLEEGERFLEERVKEGPRELSDIREA